MKSKKPKKPKHLCSFQIQHGLVKDGVPGWKCRLCEKIVFSS